MSLQSSTTLSRPHEEGQLSYAITVFDTRESDRIVSCIFRLPAEKDANRKSLPSTSDEKNKSSTCTSTSTEADELIPKKVRRLTGPVDIKAAESLNEGPSHYKIVAKRSKDKKWEFGVDRVVETKKIGNTILENTAYSIDDLKFFEQHFDFEFLEQEKNWDEFAKGFVQHISKRKENRTNEDRTPCERLLQTISEHSVFTFANRSIGSIQWSRSQKVSGEHKEKNYKTAQGLAEILFWFLDETNKHGEAQFEGQEELFKFITDDSGYQFELAGHGEEKQIVAKRCMPGQPNPETIYLLKVPEGILEAKNCAILLTASIFQTVCHEDPERGMHPQMIARLRDSLLNIQGKVVIATTHHPAFLNFNTAARTFLFRKKDRRQSWIYSGKDVFGKQELTCILTRGFISRLFFGKRLLFVEGISDELLITTFFRALIKRIKDDSEAFQPFFDSLDIQYDNFADLLRDFERFVSSLDVIHMEGAGGSKHMFNLRNAMKIEGYFLLDYDEIYAKRSRERLENELVQKTVEFVPTRPKCECQSSYVRQFEDVGILIWEIGAIEKVTQQIARCDPSQQLEQRLKDLHILNESKNKKLFRSGEEMYSSEDWLAGGEAILDVCMVTRESNDMNRLITFLAKLALNEIELPWL